MEWISVKERLPEPSDDSPYSTRYKYSAPVLTWDELGFTVAIYSPIYGWTGGDSIPEPIFWAEITPPKGKE